MAKKNTKKTTEITQKMENTVTSTIVTNAEEVASNFVRVEPLDAVVNVLETNNTPSKPKIKYMSPLELEAYERLLKMLVLYYEQNLRLDESEGRPVMSENRNRYTRLSILHKRLMQFIENKVMELEDYDWEN